MTIVENMARTQAVENFRDIRLVLSHAESLVLRLEGHLSRLPFDRGALAEEVGRIACQLRSMANRLEAAASQNSEERRADLLP